MINEVQQTIRRLMQGQSEGTIEAAIREAIGCEGPVKLRPSEKRPPPPQYPTYLKNRIDLTQGEYK